MADRSREHRPAQAPARLPALRLVHTAVPLPYPGPPATRRLMTRAPLLVPSPPPPRSSLPSDYEPDSGGTLRTARETEGHVVRTNLLDSRTDIDSVHLILFEPARTSLATAGARDPGGAGAAMGARDDMFAACRVRAAGLAAAGGLVGIFILEPRPCPDTLVRAGLAAGAWLISGRCSPRPRTALVGVPLTAHGEISPSRASSASFALGSLAPS